MDNLSYLKEIYSALDTLQLTGYVNCKTYSNCMEALNLVINNITNAETANSSFEEYNENQNKSVNTEMEIKGE